MRLEPGDGPADDHTPQRVVVKVRTPGYVPPGFTVRARIDDELYTADASEVQVAAALKDPQVISVEHGRRLHEEKRPE
ncbi:MAG: hypothetical protein QOF58_4392 [Pseudonocardiales bacterium]|jgi:hypothetical protein|nr:hypothetical protein [Pseudonocardiales bacterium]